jgi:hypothetical protein
LTKNDSFDPKRPETHFFFWLTWFDPYWPGELGFGQKWQFWPETARNSFFTLVDMVWPVLTRWTRFWSKMTVLTRNGPKLIFYPGRHGRTRIDSMDSVLTRKLIFYSGRHGLTRIDSVDSVLMERCGWLEKNIFFLILNFFLIFFGFL